MKNAENPVLSISLLASNRLETIPRCLESLTPIREAIPCELIIVDTSNNPEVHKCILKYTDIVERFEWCNDFSKARNVGLNKAKGEWFMFIDDDEWFLDSEPLIDFFVSGEYKEYGYAHYTVRSYVDKEFKEYSNGWVKRLTKLGENTQFYSKVHEYLAPNIGKNKALEAIVGHSGYIYETQEDKRKHFERNSTLLKKMEEEEPDNLRWKIQQMQEYRCMGDWINLEKYCKKSIDYLHRQNYKVVVPQLAQLYVGYVNALVNNRKFKDAKEYYLRCKRAKVFDNLLILNAFMDVFMVKVGYELEDYEMTCKHAKAYMDAYKLYQNDPKAYEGEEIGNMYAEVFTENMLYIVNDCLLFAELELGVYDNLEAYYPYLKWERMDPIHLTKIQINLLSALLSLEDYEVLKVVFKDSLSTITMKSNLAQWMLKEKQVNEQIFVKISKMIRNIDIWKWYELYIELIKLQSSSDELDKKNIETIFIKQVPNIFQIPNTVRSAFQNHEIEIESLYKELDFSTWKNQLQEHMECMKMSEFDELKEGLENSSLKDDVRFGYFMMLYSEQKLTQSMDAGLHMDEYSNLLASFSTYTCITYEALYGANIRELPAEELPDNYHAALWLQKFFEKAANDLRGALPCLGKVAEVYPFLQECVKYYLHLIKKEVFMG